MSQRPPILSLTGCKKILWQAERLPYYRSQNVDPLWWHRRFRLQFGRSTAFFVSLAAALASSAAWAQSAPTPAFEVASIRAAGQQAADQSVTLGLHIDGSQLHGRLALKDFIGIAYRLKPYQISGPDWLASERFDIAATIPADASSRQIPERLQTLLADRFQMKVHHDKKEFPVYALQIGKGALKLQEEPAEPDPDDAGLVDVAGTGSAQGVAVNLGHGASYTFSNNRFEGKKLTMAQAAGNLERFLDRPIVDMTGLKGRYDFTLEVTDEDYRLMLIRAGVNAGVVLPPSVVRLLDNGSPASLFGAIEKLGLKLDARKAPLDLLVIDEVRKTPTEN